MALRGSVMASDGLGGRGWCSGALRSSRQPHGHSTAARSTSREEPCGPRPEAGAGGVDQAINPGTRVRARVIWSGVTTGVLHASVSSQ